jgi:RNA polymerase sigma-70 factor (ECF subfamily)
MTPDQPDTQAALLKAIPHLRAFAISLTGSVDRADDLVQEALVRGLSHLDQFTPGTSMRAWLFTILRNQFHTTFRKIAREIDDPEGTIAGRLSTLPEQHGHLDLADLQIALAKLPVHQREVLLLIGAEGLSYEETSRIVGANIGTVKSRMNRARARLAELLYIKDEDDLGSDRVIRAALADRSGHQRDVEQVA